MLNNSENVLMQDELTTHCFQVWQSIQIVLDLGHAWRLSAKLEVSTDLFLCAIPEKLYFW